MGLLNASQIDTEFPPQLEGFILAVLDTTVSERDVDLELLESDANGKPTKETFGKGRSTCYSVIVLNKFEVDIISHLATTVSFKISH